ncbi:MAG: class IV adenylate cyclase [Pirellulales bacterium]
MAIEVEQKFRVSDVTSLERQLAALGAAPGATESQVDSYFAHPQRDFAQTDEALRLRRVGQRNYVTYKGPKLDTSTKTRHEIEIELPEGQQAADNAAGLLVALSFGRFAEVRKRRVHYTLVWGGREIGVALDQVEGLGDFVELEIMAGEDHVDAARDAISSLAGRLNLSNSERRSYLELLVAARQGAADGG